MLEVTNRIELVRLMINEFHATGSSTFYDSEDPFRLMVINRKDLHFPINLLSRV